MVSAKITLHIKSKIVELMSYKNGKFGWQVLLLVRILYYDRLKYQMKIINGKYEDKDFSGEFNEKMSKTLAIS